MSTRDEKIPNPQELEKEIGEFLTRKFGNNIKIVSPLSVPQTVATEEDKAPPKRKKKLHFDLKPEELIAHLDQFIIKQDTAKAILATKICTHFNRTKHSDEKRSDFGEMVGGIKNNVLMVGPTGVGKTYMVKLIAKKIGVPFVKGDATKFSETGYVGGDVEDLVRDLVREADDDMDLAECGIIYIDEIDKIASSHNLIGADVSRTGVQRALLKPMEETEVDLKVPHDPISMIQEVERFRRTGKRDKRTVNTKNILFIMSGAFSDIGPIVKRRISDQGIGFGAQITSAQEQADILRHLTSEDLTKYGFESEFVGRLPVKAVFERLNEEDLFAILRNPNNPVILGKKLDFAAYGIEVRFEDTALRLLAKRAFAENTGARGLVSAIERALLLFEKKLPSTSVKTFPVTASVIEKPETALEELLSGDNEERTRALFERLTLQEKQGLKEYIESNKENLAKRFGLSLTPSRIDTIAALYCEHITDVGSVINRIKSYYDEVKKVELTFLRNHDTNIVFEEDAMDHLIRQVMFSARDSDAIYEKLEKDFALGLRLVKDKTGKSCFFITKKALMHPDTYIGNQFKDDPREADRNREE